MAIVSTLTTPLSPRGQQWTRKEGTASRREEGGGVDCLATNHRQSVAQRLGRRARATPGWHSHGRHHARAECGGVTPPSRASPWTGAPTGARHGVRKSRWASRHCGGTAAAGGGERLRRGEAVVEGRASQHAHRVPVFEAPRARAQAAACAAALSRVRARAAAGLATLLAAAIFRASSTREAAQSRATSPAATAVTIAAVFSSATATTPSTATATTTPTAAATTTVPLLKHTRSYTPIRVDDHRHRSWPAGSRVAARPPRRRSPPPPPLLLRLPISFSPKPPPPSVTS